jgi:hypothetical protein
MAGAGFACYRSVELRDICCAPWEGRSRGCRGGGRVVGRQNSRCTAPACCESLPSLTPRLRHKVAATQPAAKDGTAKEVNMECEDCDSNAKCCGAESESGKLRIGVHGCFPKAQALIVATTTQPTRITRPDPRHTSSQMFRNRARMLLVSLSRHLDVQ